MHKKAVPCRREGSRPPAAMVSAPYIAPAGVNDRCLQNRVCRACVATGRQPEDEALPHRRIAERLGVRHETLPLESAGAKQWRSDAAQRWSRVEDAALCHYGALGWQGHAGEGGLVLNLLKAAAFPSVPPRLRGVFSEAIFANNLAPPLEIGLAQLLANIREADEGRIIRNYRFMAAGRAEGVSGSSILDYFPTLSEPLFVGLFRAMGRERLHAIATAFSADPYRYRKGWPDLTLWRGTGVAFREIKAPGDRLGSGQRDTIRDILLPLGHDVGLVDVSALAAGATVSPPPLPPSPPNRAP